VSWLFSSERDDRIKEAAELAASQASDNLHPWETGIKWGQGQDGLPWPKGVESERKR